MKKIIIFILILCLNCYAKKVEIKNGWFFVDGEKFFIKGVGYEAGARPYRIPWERKFEKNLRDFDFKLIKAAGINTLRCWSPMSEQELQLARQYGFMVIQGIWTDYTKYFNNDSFEKEALENIRKSVENSVKFDNILMFLVMNEPQSDILIEAGEEKVKHKMKLLYDTAKKAAPDIPVSFSNCPLTDFLNTGIWDAVCYNNYMYGPSTVNFGLGYRGYNEWLKKNRAENKPLVITEFGLSVSPAGPGNYGYGGNTLKEQSDGDISMYTDQINAGVAGSCPFMWVDGWWKSPQSNAKTEFTHDDHAEEWFGIIEVDDPDNDIYGHPRPVYYAIKDFNQFIVTDPKDLKCYENNLPVKIFSDLNIESVEYQFEDRIWKPLKKTGKKWWTENVDITSLKKGLHFIQFKVKKNDGTYHYSKKQFIKEDYSGDPLKINLSSNKNTVNSGEDIKVYVTLLTGKGEPVGGQELNFNYYTYGSREKSIKVKTDSNGKYYFEYPTLRQEGYIAFSASAEYKKGKYIRRIGNQIIIKINPVERNDIELAKKFDEKILLDIPVYNKNLFPTVYNGSSKTDIHISDKNINITYNSKSAGSWAYLEAPLEKPVNLKNKKYYGIQLEITGKSIKLKYEIIDSDGERWYFSEDKISSKDNGIRLYPLENLTRDIYDGVKNGNNMPDLESIKGIALVFSTGNTGTAKIKINKLTVY